MTFPAVVIRPIVLLPKLVNHSAPSGPAVISAGNRISGPEWLVIYPVVVMRPIEATLVNHSAPSGPTVRPDGVTVAPLPR